ncbi:insulinase family protein [Patescibacteria group bacterium]|nr:insulinase family protein [Patescibacteria group bacterium]MCL5010408.1 insulinase family protein [Patescibacteria group bacterium]
MQFSRTVLGNGLRVLTIPMPSFESATVLAMVGAGSRYENRGNNGISHFLEHMAFKGTAKRPSAMAISSLIEGIGGEFNAFTGKEETGYYIKSSKNHIDLCLDVLADMLQNSLLDSKEIDRERGVILEEINLYEDTPSRKIGDVYERLLYADTPLGWDISGEKEVIGKINRSDFVSYMSGLYSASNMTLVIAGGIDPKKALEMAERFFGGMNVFATNKYEEAPEGKDEPQVLIKSRETEQAHIALGVRTVFLNHKDRYPLSILAAILGGGMSSRLFHEIREKRGLAYYVRSSSDHYSDCGSFVSTAGVDPKRIEEAIKVMVEEYGKISKVKSQKSAITKEELQRAKELIKGHLVLDLEDSRSVASFYANQELLEKQIYNPDQVIEKIRQITVEDVEQAAKRYLSRPLKLAVIGNFADGQRFRSLIK